MRRPCYALNKEGAAIRRSIQTYDMKKSQGETFVFIGNFYDYDEACFENADRKVLWHDVDKIAAEHVAFKLPTPNIIRRRLREKVAKDIINRHTDDIVVLYANRACLNALAKPLPDVRGHIVLRNVYDHKPKKMKLVSALQENGHTVWSFDPGECAKHGFNLYRQFQFVGRIQEIANEPVDCDFSFLGARKGRACVVKEVAAVIRGQNLRVKTRTMYGEEDGARGKDKAAHVPYRDYLRYSCSAKCFIDVVKPGQRGLTSRPLDAIAYKRKLVTNCADVRDAPFYRPQNIIVFDEPRELAAHDLGAFVNAPFVDVPQSDVRPFTLDALLGRIAAAHENKDKTSAARRKA